MSDWASGVVVSGVRRASPRTSPYKLGGLQGGFLIHPTPEILSIPGLSLRCLLQHKVALAPNHG